MGTGPHGPKSCDVGKKDQSQVPSTPSAITAQGCRLVCLVKGKRRKFGSVISEGVVNAKTGCWMLSTELNINGNGSVWVGWALQAACWRCRQGLWTACHTCLYPGMSSSDAGNSRPAEARQVGAGLRFYVQKKKKKWLWLLFLTEFQCSLHWVADASVLTPDSAPRLELGFMQFLDTDRVFGHFCVQTYWASNTSSLNTTFICIFLPISFSPLDYFIKLCEYFGWV